MNKYLYTKTYAFSIVVVATQIKHTNIIDKRECMILWAHDITGIPECACVACAEDSILTVVEVVLSVIVH